MKSPLALVTVPVRTPVSVLVASSTAPEMTPPVASVTRPNTVLRASCGSAGVERNDRAAMTHPVTLQLGMACPSRRCTGEIDYHIRVRSTYQRLDHFARKDRRPLGAPVMKIRQL